MSPPDDPPSLLEVRDLRVRFDTLSGPARSVDGVSFTLAAGETLGIVGESGCGKSVTALAVLRLLAAPPAHVSGSVRLAGEELLAMPERAMRRIRGNRISMVFQEPMTSLNPVLTIGRQIAEAVRVHQGLGRAEAHARAVAMLRLVQIPEAERRAGEYPFQLSGGMRQRVVIALALACRPEVLIADEPTTALDVTIQAQILDLVARLQRELGMAVLLITHDLGVVAETCRRVVVMYAGRIVEQASTVALFDRPLHPYTRALMASMPSLNSTAARLAEIPGLVPSPQSPRRGCAFAPRCPLAFARCSAEEPALVEQAGGHAVACFAVADGRAPPLLQPLAEATP